MLKTIILISEYTDKILKSLDIFWKGLLAIFIVISLIVGMTYLIKALVSYLEKLKVAKEQFENEEKNSTD